MTSGDWIEAHYGFKEMVASDDSDKKQRIRIFEENKKKFEKKYHEINKTLGDIKIGNFSVINSKKIRFFEGIYGKINIIFKEKNIQLLVNLLHKIGWDVINVTNGAGFLIG